MENKHFIDTNAIDKTDWAMHLAFYCFLESPLSERQQNLLLDGYTNTFETGIKNVDLTADEHIPLFEVSLDMRTTEFDLPEVDQAHFATEAGMIGMSKEAALAKAFIATIGGLASAGIDLEEVEVKAAYVATIADLEFDRIELENPSLFVENERYREDEMARDVFNDERESTAELMSLAA